MSRDTHHQRKLSICFVSDFFLPHVGGVELHIAHLAGKLAERGHKVCVFTHSYNDDTTFGDNEKNTDSNTNETYSGVRYLKSGVKVYYVPRVTIRGTNCCFPTIFGVLKIFRIACVRENVNVVHAHQGGTLSHECVLHAKTLQIPCVVFTDHSLFGMNDDVASIHSNKVLRMTLGEADRAVCVTNAAKENTCLRGGMNVVPVRRKKTKKRKGRDDEEEEEVVYELRGFDPRKIEVIPNAVDGEAFYPPSRATEKRSEGKSSSRSSGSESSNSSSNSGSAKRSGKKEVTIVVCSRLTYRKGIHLLAKLIPLTLKRNKNVRFIIAGSGPMEPHLREVCEKTHEKECKGKVEFLGDAKHENVPNILRRGDIFLNCSLTEAFCTAIVEAASCGLVVVATGVGGVPEVLPGVTMVTSPAASEKKSTMETGTGGRRRKLKAGKPKEITSSFLAPPTVSGLFEQLEKAIALVANGEIGDREREALGDQILQKYSWSAVAKTTENLYLDVLLEKEKRKKKRKKTVEDERDDDDFANRVIEKCTSQGVVFGPLLCCIAALTKLYLKALEFADPAENIRERSNFFTTTNNNPIIADSSKRQRNDGNDAMRGDDVDIGRFLVSKRKSRRERRRRE